MTRRVWIHAWRSRRAHLPALLAVATLCSLLPAASARATFTPATLMSGTAKLQFEQAEAPALSRDGRYVAFQGSLAGVTGVWRRDLASGAIEAVASAYDSSDPGLGAPAAELAAPDASAPSISASGRYVAFTTTADLEPEHALENGARVGEPAVDQGCPEVYVRDMDLPAGAPGAYTLASALQGGIGITYAGCQAPPSGFAVAGAQAALGVALSEDGHSVAFTVLSRSNLARGSGCAPATPLYECPAETPPSQVAVHDLQSGTTTLVTVTPAGAPVPAGGAFPSEASEQVSRGAVPQGTTGSTAAISADGSTVAWLGSDVGAQVPQAAAEIEEGTVHNQGEAAGGYEAEPLWRRIADGPSAVTRRLLAGAGLDMFYNRNEGFEVVRAGSFVDTSSRLPFVAPALSADGETVALIANAFPFAALTGVELSGNPPQSDAYVVHVSDDSSIAPEVLALTTTPDYDVLGTAGEGSVTNVALSPDGTRVAFDTGRERLVLAAGISLISPTAQSRTAQIYEANLALGTLQRASVTWDGAEPTNNAGLLSLGDGGKLAFASMARNLFYGDSLDTSQVYLAEELPSETPVAPQLVGVAPSEPGPAVEWRLNATVAAQRDGSVLVRVWAPGAGRLSVTATAQLPTPGARAKHNGKRSSRKSRRARTVPRPVHRAHPAHTAHAARARARRTRSGPRVRLVTRAVAAAAMGVGAPSEQSVPLRASAAYRAEIDSARGLYAIVHVALSAPSERTLTAQIPVTFHRAPPSKGRR